MKKHSLTSFHYGQAVFITTVIVMFLFGMLYFSSSAKEPTKLIEHKTDYSYVQSLKDSVEDLEAKARILNRYLQMKNLEYIEICDLVAKSKDKTWNK